MTTWLPRDERWQDGSGNLALSQTGNWTQRRLDLSGDGDFTDTDELDDTGTFNKANEWLTRDLDNNSGTTGNNFTLAYDAAGNMLDDGRNYEYVWDGFGRLRQVKKTTDQTLVAEYRYNGLGHRLSWKYDTDGDLDVDGSDQTYFFVYDLKWRPVATYRGTDANPKERFIFHNAGLAGRGTSSYIDSVIMRDKDANTAWDAASDATLEERRYYVQNWRADVVALLTAGGDVSEWVRYSAYGEATVYPFVNGDYDGSGGVDGDDVIAFSAAWDSNANAADVDRANGVDGDDTIAFYASWDNGWMSTAWTAGGGLPANAGQLSVTSGNRIGYAGYQFDPATEQYHVRHRVYSPEMGRWTRRDPLGYVDGMGMMEYVGSAAVATTDPEGKQGLRCRPGVINGCQLAFGMSWASPCAALAKLIAAPHCWCASQLLLGMPLSAVMGLCGAGAGGGGAHGAPGLIKAIVPVTVILAAMAALAYPVPATCENHGAVSPPGFCTFWCRCPDGLTHNGRYGWQESGPCISGPPNPYCW